MLTGLFYMVGFHTNINKTVGMNCQSCPLDVRHSDMAYTRQMMGVVLSFQERKQERVRCPECATDLVMGSMSTHRQAQYGNSQGPQWEATPNPPQPGFYRVLFPWVYELVDYPVEGCRGGRRREPTSGFSSCTATCRTR